MPSSIRGSLLGWYSVILTGVLLAFGTTLYLSAARAVLSRHDALIESRAAALAGGVKFDPADGWEFELSDDYLRAIAETTYFAIWNKSGQLLRAGGTPGPTTEPARTVTGFRERGFLRENIARNSDGATVLVGVSLAEDNARLRGLLSSIIGGGFALLCLALVGGFWLAGRATAPIARATDLAARISDSDLSVRFDTQNVPRELRGLCDTLNQTFTRLEVAFSRLTRFTADASHELRTPVAIIRAQVELALSRPRPADEYQETLQICLRGTARMSGIVEGLLTLARADSGTERVARNEVKWDVVVRTAAETLRATAQERNVTLDLALSPITLKGDADRLADVATNLIANAIRYNREGGRVQLTLSRIGDHADLTVADTGIGIPPDLRSKIFERFFRVDTARSRADGGVGLGLAITKWIVQAHGGSISVEENEDGGSLFTVRLPA